MANGKRQKKFLIGGYMGASGQKELEGQMDIWDDRAGLICPLYPVLNKHKLNGTIQ